MAKPIFTLLLLTFFSLNITGQILTETIPGTEVSFQMALVPAGRFSMGGTAETQNTLAQGVTQRRVELDSFWIGLHEVGYDEFIIFYQKEYDSDATNHPESKYKADAVSRPTPQYIDYTYGMGKSGFPAVSMTQQAALRYCQWLYEKTGHFYRLPTEAEWEFACRGGNSDVEIPTADLWDYAWTFENSFEKYHKLGQKKPNAIGLFDMQGNVMEWTLDYYQEDYLEKLSDSISYNPWIVPERRHSRTVKGGSYDNDAKDCSCSARQKSSPRWQARDPQIPKSKWWNPDSPFVGFRIVRPVKQLSREEVAAFFEQAIKD
ncbi:MAG: formylglycine-generating enzyme family protein [Saprospiraceae bacterium]